MDETTNALIAGISAKVKLLAENAEAHLTVVGESAAEDIHEAVSTLAQAGHAAAEEAARRASKLTSVPAIALTTFLSAAALCLAFVGGVYYGASVRQDQAETHDALAAWALTPAGREAYALDEANTATGGIRMFTECNQPGWRILERHGERLCMPYPKKHEGLSGWLLGNYGAQYQTWILPGWPQRARRDSTPTPKRP